MRKVFKDGFFEHWLLKISWKEAVCMKNLGKFMESFRKIELMSNKIFELFENGKNFFNKRSDNCL